MPPVLRTGLQGDIRDQLFLGSISVYMTLWSGVHSHGLYRFNVMTLFVFFLLKLLILCHHVDHRSMRQIATTGHAPSETILRNNHRTRDRIAPLAGRGRVGLAKYSSASRPPCSKRSCLLSTVDGHMMSDHEILFRGWICAFCNNGDM